MAEQLFHYATGDDKTIERVIQEEAIHLNHMVLPRGEGFPPHIANATVYMAVMRGRLTLSLNHQPPRGYERGDILKIQRGTPMRGWNEADGALELLIVKAPAPER